ncbi:MAG: MmcQ/YjbR family DNA-binding protein [Candidatus Gracilibacteria bacterium]|nr:MmcQ/YjbR family DNA-binding protein [Candidatus Gracilibacteria bacterium]
MTLKQYKSYCLKKKGVQETYPFGNQTVVMKVMGKMFTISNVTAFKMSGEMKPAFHHISLKCDPELADDLKRNFKSIIPGWHLNKTHWISLIMDNSLKNKLIKSLIDQAYDIVVNKLPVKKKEELKHHA